LRLEALVKKGKGAAYKRLHAQILLTADVGERGPGWKDQPISQALGVSTRTVERVPERLVEQGLEAALERALQQRYKSLKLDGEGQARLVALACSAPPEGRRRWTLQLLADRLVSLGCIDEISHETVRQVLKKTN
jgi:transposase